MEGVLDDRREGKATWKSDVERKGELEEQRGRERDLKGQLGRAT